MSALPPLHAFIDESGQRARSAKSSDHFVMTAVIVADEHRHYATDLLATIRRDLGRKPTDTLHWKNIKQHSQRLHASQIIGSAGWLTLSSVVVCKRHLTGNPLNDDQTYLYTLRYLLERLSWFARDSGRVLNYTTAHIVRFQIAKLRAYEAKLQADARCQITWPSLNSKGGQMDQPHRLEELQLADLAASATGAAFNPDAFGNTEIRYLCEMSPRLYRRGGNLLSYGMKLHPSDQSTQAAYPWVAAL